jgi:hypothetical protein
MLDILDIPSKDYIDIRTTGTVHTRYNSTYLPSMSLTAGGRVEFRQLVFTTRGKDGILVFTGDGTMGVGMGGVAVVVVAMAK